MDKKKVLVMVRIGDISKEIEAKWNDWYDTTHIPNRINKPGFLFARRFTRINGEYKYFTLYELSSIDALTSEPYIKLREWEASLPPETFERMTSKLPNFSRGVYEQVYPEEGEYRMPNSEIVLGLGHDVPPNRDEEFNAWYNTEHIPAMVDRVPGFLTARRFKVVEGPLNKFVGPFSYSPRYITLYDLDSEKVFESEAYLRERNSPWCSWVRSWYTRCFRVVGRRIYHSDSVGLII